MSQKELHTESQCKTVLRHMTMCKSITARTAVINYGIYRLASRINDLRKQGHDIKSELHHNENNRSIHYSIYSLIIK